MCGLQQIVGQKVDMSDVEAIDKMTANYLRGIRECDAPGDKILPITDEEEWAEAYADMKFVTVSEKSLHRLYFSVLTYSLCILWLLQM